MGLPPVVINAEAVSGITGSISIACWVIVFTPQLYENFRRQSAEGLSLTFVVLWLAGDIFNVLGAILQGLLPTMIILALYYTVADIVLLLQCLFYNNRKELAVDPKHLSPATPLLEDVESYRSIDQGQETSAAAASRPSSRPKSLKDEILFNSGVVVCVLLCGFLGWYLSPHNTDSGALPEQPFDYWGQVFGWLCAVLYLGSRVPQILLNFQRKSCEGVSFLFFLFACLGNLTYVVSILAKDLSLHYLLVNASWLAGSVGTLALDLVIFAQFWVYNVQGEGDEADDYSDDYSSDD